MQKIRKQGLVADLWPNIRLIQLSGLFISAYYADNGMLMRLLRKIYSWIVTLILFTQYILIIIFAFTESYNADQRATYSVTILFFTHSLIKFVYFSMSTEKFYRTLGLWNNPNQHPLFAESNARHRASAISRMRKLLMWTGGITLFTVGSWTTLTFVGDSVRDVPDPETDNETMSIETPRLLIPSYYPFETMQGPGYIAALTLQVC